MKHTRSGIRAVYRYHGAMQRMLVTVVVIALVLASLTVGALAAHWPFWHRAWQWHSAEGPWPELAGPSTVLQPSATPLPLRLSGDVRLAPRTGDSPTSLLLLGNENGEAWYWSAPGMNVHSLLDGRGLSVALLAPLLGTMQQHSARPRLDEPLRMFLAEWREDARGEITLRQLLWQMSGLSAGAFEPLNPFDPRAQLHSGPDFNRAALHMPLAWPPGSHFEPAAVNAQLVSRVAGSLAGGGFAQALQRNLWGRFAEHEAVALLDHRRGNVAGHCCLRAAPVDWLRLALVLAADGVIGKQRLLPEGYVAEMTTASPVNPGYGLGYRLVNLQDQTILVADTPGRRLAIAPRTGRALLWVGEGAAPAWLYELLLPAAFGTADHGIGG
jgi:hypothetical protein